MSKRTIASRSLALCGALWLVGAAAVGGVSSPLAAIPDGESAELFGGEVCTEPLPLMPTVGCSTCINKLQCAGSGLLGDCFSYERDECIDCEIAAFHLCSGPTNQYGDDDCTILLTVWIPECSTHYYNTLTTSSCSQSCNSDPPPGS